MGNAMPTKKPCHCAAYKFPHRAGSGLCADPGAEPPTCNECQWANKVVDPFATGDTWYAEIECEHPRGCPWGKLDG